MERYNDYKDSGVDWLDEIPKHWHLKRIKDLTKIISKGTTPSTEGETYTNSGVRFIKAENLKENGKVVDNPVFYISEKTNKILKRSQLKANDLLLVIAGATTGKIAVIQKTQLPANTNQAVCFLRLKKEEQRVSLRYKFYFINSSSFQSLIWLFAVTSAQPNLPMSILGRIDFCYPPLLEQSQIANYLDIKTTAIDKKIKLLKQKIKHYKAYRKTLINETVTKGLDKSVKLKDSGIDWIGGIPEHWDIVRVKDKFFTIAGGTPSTKEKSFWIGEIPWIPSGAVQNGEVNESVIKSYISDDALMKSSTKMAKKDSILIALTGATCSNIGYLNFDTTINQSIVSIDSNKKDVYHRYYFYFLISAKQKIRTLMTGGAQGGINQGDVKYFKVCFFSKKEQKQIADFLDAKTNTIDNIVNNIEAQITTLKELRKTLINEVVTGKVKVTA